MNISYWERGITECDVLIVGAGFLGAWTAYRLAAQHPSLKITVIERSHMSYGASIRNAGFATSGSVSEILADERQYGTEAAFSIVRQRREGIRTIREKFEGFSYMEFDQCGGFEKFTEATRQPIIDNIARINSVVGGFELREDGVFVEDDGLLDSYKLLRMLHDLGDAHGVRYMFGTQLRDLLNYDEHVAAFVQDGARDMLRIAAGKVLMCTNGFTHKVFPNSQIRPQRNHVIVTGVLDEPIPRIGFHAEEGYVYWRPVYDPSGAQRLLIGGMRHRSLATEGTSDLTHNEEIFDHLTKYIEDNITDQFTIDYRWTGIMGFTSNKLNVLEKHNENIYAACCCNGQGVAMAPVFSKEIVDQLF